ncbi:MAG: type 1 glutamine amidotransferase [Myxococcaceae bacterium]|nr:type 1 glutamine amidotransferase [Myxococcaceae bacterium]
MRAVVLQHEAHEGLGLFEAALAAEGFSFTKRFRGVDHHDLEAELVVIMGGSMSVTDTSAHPFLQDELAFLIERLALNRPCLGICLGAQLLASAAGSEVTRGKNGFEVSVGPVRWTKAGLEDPVLAGVRPKSTVAHWHEDTFTPVPGATLLASTDRYTQQAFRLGDSFGFQFHLELSGDAWAAWVEGAKDELELYEKDVTGLAAQASRLRSAEAENRAVIERLAHHFARRART